MTGICGLAGIQRTSAVSKIDAMLASMKRRGPPIRSVTAKGGRGRDLSMGLCGFPSNSTLADLHVVGDFMVAIDGCFFGEESSPVRAKLSSQGGIESLRQLLRVPGAYSFVAIDEGRMLAGRDPVGQKPLYYGTDATGAVGFASLRCALKEIGATDSEPLPPGEMVIVSDRGCSVEDGYRLINPQEKRVSEAEAVAQLRSILLEAVSKTVPNGSGIAFSGGLDSALVAHSLKESGLDAELVTVGVANQPELDHAVQAATEMGLHISVCQLSPSEILDSLPTVVETVESSDPVVVGVSAPFYFACQKAREMGFKAIVAGQLSDELFGGYARFEELALREGLESVRLEMWRSLLAASSNDFEPGDKLAVSLGLELRCPFAYLPLVEYTLQLPLSLKVKLLEGKVIRKYVLRKLAAGWGLPDSVVTRAKKAVQYSSGVQKVLEKEAKRRGMSLRNLLESLRV